jgi:uncharacterized protein (DUF433 family)
MPELDPSAQPDDSCFPGTGVPVRLLEEHLGGGGTLEEFLDAYPDVDPAEAEEAAGRRASGSG